MKALKIGIQEPTWPRIAASCIAHSWNSALLVNTHGVRVWTMNEKRTAPMHDRVHKAVIVIPTAFALWFLDGFAFQYLTLDRDRFGIYWERREWLYVHILAGMLALLLGPLQLWLGMNRRAMALHRILGGAYMMGVFTSGGAALYLARHTDFGWTFGMGLTSMAVAWIISTSLAGISIWLGVIDQHREWMIRSCVLTFGFVMFRMVVLGLQIMGVGTTLDQMTAASWFSWSVPLLLTECIIQGRKIFASKRSLFAKKGAQAHETPAINLFDSAPL